VRPCRHVCSVFADPGGVRRCDCFILLRCVASWRACADGSRRPRKRSDALGMGFHQIARGRRSTIVMFDAASN
jgi:hypothetical protein